MKKTPRWRQMRLQKKRENQRLRKQAKPHHDHVFAVGGDAAPTIWERMTHLLGKQTPEEKATLDRRERRAIKQGNR